MKTKFDNISVTQLYILVNLIADSEVRRTEHLRRKYEERAVNFSETLTLLIELNLVVEKNIDIYPLKKFDRIGLQLESFKHDFIVCLFNSANQIFSEINEFIDNFILLDNGWHYLPTIANKLKYSQIRNLLLELEFIKVNSYYNGYIVNPRYETMVIELRQQSLASFKSSLLANELLAFNAEKAILRYELVRLSRINILESEIEHTSQVNVLAGYDVRSFEDELDINSQKVYRYIEVKAVSKQGYKFFWSRNEIKIAKRFGDSYYLYLLPVNTVDSFDLEGLQVYKNPFRTLFLNQADWYKTGESYSFYKKDS